MLLQKLKLIKGSSESMDGDTAKNMSRDAKNDSSLQVILQILFIGLIGLLPTCLRHFQGEIVLDEYIFDAVCKNFNRRLTEISTKSGLTRTSIMEDFIAHLKELGEGRFKPADYKLLKNNCRDFCHYLIFKVLKPSKMKRGTVLKSD